MFSLNRFAKSALIARSFFPRWHRKSWVLQYSTLVYNLFPTCSSCGVKLQNTDPKKEGYYQLPTTKPKLIREEDKVFDKYIKELSPEDRELLNVSDNVSKANEKPVKEKDGTNIQCIRCRSALYQSKFNWDEHPAETLDDVISSIPLHGNIVYLVNAMDFPFSLDSRIFQYRNAKDITFIITKCDLLYSSLSMNNKYGATFFRDYLWRKYNVDGSKVHAVSGLSDWNMEAILKEIPDNSYLIGSVNSGKSTLLKSLLYVSSKKDSKLISSDKRKALENVQDRAVNKGLPKNLYARQQRKALDRYKLLNGPGASHMPGFTRNHILYDFKGKTIFDVPGFSCDAQHGVYRYMSPENIKQISKGSLVPRNGMYNSPYETLKGEQVYTVGGIFYLETPSDTIFQVRKCINFERHVFSSMEKAMSVLQHIEDYPSLARVFAVDKLSLEGLRKFVVPPFYGSIDLVFQNVGHINITPTGKRITNDPLILYLPQNVRALARQPISKYLYKTLLGRDKNGNPLRKENWKSKSTAVLHRFTGSVPFTADLIPASSNDPYESINDYCAKVNPSLSYTRSTVLDESNRYKYWI